MRPHIDIEKYVAVDGGAWDDADTAPGPEVLDGSYVEFMFVVTNPTTDHNLINLVLSDTMFDVSGCTVPAMLGPGESFDCVIGPFECVEGQHMNVATIDGESESGTPLTDSDPAHYIGRCGGDIDIEKYVAVDGGAWDDADTAPGPEVLDGSYVEFMFVVTNPTTDHNLINLVLSDTMFDVSGCTVPAMLGPGESFDCVIGPFECVEGQHMNVATIDGETESGTPLTDSDPAHYLGLCGGGDQPGTGTPGYWMNHPDAWPVEEITVGGMTYSKDVAIAIMKAPVRRDKTYTMFPALVAAMLNVMIGNDDSCIADTITEADAWMMDNPVGSGVKGNSDAWTMGEPLYWTLDSYNNGEMCAPSRDSLEMML